MRRIVKSLSEKNMILKKNAFFTVFSSYFTLLPTSLYPLAAVVSMTKFHVLSDEENFDENERKKLYNPSWQNERKQKKELPPKDEKLVRSNSQM